MKVHGSPHAYAPPVAAQSYIGTSVDELIAIVRGGDLRALIGYVTKFEFAARQLEEIVNCAAKRINRLEVWIPAVAITTDNWHGKTVERALFVFRADSVHRVLVITSDPNIAPIVGGPPKDNPDKLPVVLNEDPALLFHQIAKLISLPRIPSPPPLTTAATYSKPAPVFHPRSYGMAPTK